MKTKNILMSAALAALVCGLITTPAILKAQNLPCTDTNIVKWLAPPQVDGGLDVKDSRNLIVLADDFPCSSSGPISDIHIWGSWLSDTQGLITNFWLGIYNDVPAIISPASGQVLVNSRPGTNLLWYQNFLPLQFAESEYNPNQPGQEYFFNPTNPPSGIIVGTDQYAWLYCFYPTNPFVQQGNPNSPTNYWLACRAQLADPATSGILFGWKTATVPYNDPAVWGTFNAAGFPSGDWQSMTNPMTGKQVDLSMKLETPNVPPPVPCVETNGVKYEQLPNIDAGLDVWNDNDALADDFVCTNPGPITDIHIWGSWLKNQIGTNTLTFWLGIYSDVQPNPLNGLTNSQPGNLLWSQSFAPGQYAEELWALGTQEQFLDPNPPAIIGPDNNVYYYCFYPTNPFVQQGLATEPKTYWLAAYVTGPAGTPYQYGWKTALTVQNDISVHVPWPGVPPAGGWKPTFESVAGAGNIPLDLAFRLTTPTNNCFVPVTCPQDKRVLCGQSWSFDPPVVGTDPCCPNPPVVTLQVITNSGPCQSYAGVWTVTEACTGTVIDVCTQNVTVVDNSSPTLIGCPANLTTYCGNPIPPPATVTATDDCSAVTLNFTQINSTQSPCVLVLTRTWTATDICNSNTATCTQQILILDTNPPVMSSCGTNFTVTNGTSWSFTMPTAAYACSGISAPVGILSSNVITTSFCSSTNIIVWSATNTCAPSPAVSTCTQIVTVVCPPNDCGNPGGVKYTQPPNLFGGYDVWNASSRPPNVTDGPWVLADDFVCTNTGYITDLHLWGSWFDDAPAPGTITFWIGIFSDVPAVLNTAGQVVTNSHPGHLIWSECFAPGQYSEQLYYTSARETFMDPGPPANLSPDTAVWYYCFSPTNPPIQHGSTVNPKIYWLAAFAQMPTPTFPYFFGWKTTPTVTHDISVHSIWSLGACPPTVPDAAFNWTPTYAAVATAPKPLDLAFEITTLTNCSSTFVTIDPIPTNKVVISWPTGVLQWSTNVVGPYVDVPGSPTSPYTNSTPPPPLYRYYRVRCN
jgi:hypothetical protein